MTVRRLWVINSNLIRVNISVNQSAAPIPTTVTVTSGQKLVSLIAYFQVPPIRGKPHSDAGRIRPMAPRVPVGGTAVISARSAAQRECVTSRSMGRKPALT